jgi:DNA repair protein RecO (recombination protein O)
MPNRTVKGVFELRTLAKSGFMPNLEECEMCSRRRFGDDIVAFFDVIGGNIICGGCVGKLNQDGEIKEYSEWGGELQKKLVRVSNDVLNVLRYVITARDEKLFSFVLHDDVINEFSTVCEKYLLEQIGMNIDSLKYYKSYEK